MACAENLFPGKYQVEEKQSGEYYAVDKGKHEAEIRVTEGNSTEDCSFTVFNSKTRITLEKTDARKKNPMEQVVFVVAEAEASQKEMTRKELLEKGKEITTDREGKISLTELKHQKAYFFTEVKTRDGYQLDETVYRIPVDEQGLIDGKKEKTLKLVNEPVVKKETPKAAEAVKTEDESRGVLFLFLLAGSAGILGAALRGRKKKRH